MSMCYWICQGIGIRANQLRPYIIRPNGRDVKQFSNYIYRRVRLWEINAIRWATG